MRGTTRTMLVAGMAATALLAAACGGSSDDTTTGTGGAGGEITVRGCTPENPLIAGNTSETCGGNILDTLTAKLVHYNAEDAAPENDIAESIETTDNQTFTIKIKKGYKFSDGTEVKAKNFVDAWNYEDVKDETSTVKEMKGLAVVDDHTFTIKTTAPVSNLPVRLGYTAFAPQPDVFFTDPEAFGKNPVGAGAFKFDSWTEGQSIVVVKNPDYSGDYAGKVDKITFKIYQDLDAAYNDLQAGNIDVTDQIPTSALIDDKYKTDLPDRNAARETGVIQFIGINPTADPKLTPEVRKAISMAIDREGINKAIFNGIRVNATGWVSPVVDGYKADVCGEVCVYDKAKAKAALDAAGGYTGQLQLAYNGDGDHKAWTEATCNSIKDALAIDCVATPQVDFKTFLTAAGNNELGLFRYGWQMDYPSIENFLTPLYATGAGSNYFGPYNNAAFEKLLAEAAAAPTLDEANAKYQEAEALLVDDMPTIPLWYGKAVIGWSDKVNAVGINAFGVPDFANITTK